MEEHKVTLIDQETGEIQLPSHLAEPRTQRTYKPLSDEDVDLIRRTVAKSANDDQFKIFIYTCNAYGLNPLKKEIWWTGQAIVVARDGYVKIANDHEEYDGMEADVVYQGDIISRRDDGSIKIEYGEEHMAFEPLKIVGAYANVYRKDRKTPSSVFVSAKDYLSYNNPVTKKYPNAMILKVAESQAIKKAFSLSGLVSQEEMGEKNE